MGKLAITVANIGKVFLAWMYW